MLSTRRLWWAALALAALTTGCSNEPATTTPAASPAASSNTMPPGPAPETPPSNTTAPAGKGEMKAEMAGEAPKTSPADAPKPEMPADEIKIEAPKVEPATKGEAPRSAAADATKLSDVEVAEIKKLPADEQILALKQVVCPVSGEPLGSMDVPIKVSAEGKTFFLCCKGCKKEVEKNPKEVVAKLGDK